MPRVLKNGDNIKSYLITKHLNTGAMANAFAAQAPDGRKVFLKQYKSPSVAVKWFADYVNYQKELNRRVREPALRRFCVHQLDSFVFKFGIDTFFQVYEFVEGGHDLETILEKIRKNPSSLNWHQRTIIAKVMMAGIHQLHEQQIAHCDLKPQNLQMLVDSSIEAGYQLKLIDMDFSVLSDRKAPWHGHAPYVGTPRYFSPEHLMGETPGRRSDIFTCGIILHELLGAGHPYPADDDVAYFDKVKDYKAQPPKLIGALPDPEATVYLANIIHRCLSPDKNTRPTAKEVNLALNGKKDSAAPPVKPPPPPKPFEALPTPIPTSTLTTVKLSNSMGMALTFNVTTSVGKQLLRQFGEEAKFADDLQFTLDRRGSEWWLVPQSGTTNYTMINGTPALTPIQLRPNDKIEIGSRASGRTILPLTVGY